MHIRSFDGRVQKGYSGSLDLQKHYKDEWTPFLKYPQNRPKILAQSPFSSRFKKLKYKIPNNLSPKNVIYIS